MLTARAENEGECSYHDPCLHPKPTLVGCLWAGAAGRPCCDRTGRFGRCSGLHAHLHVCLGVQTGAPAGSAYGMGDPRACLTPEPLQPHHHDALPSNRNDAPIPQVPQTTQALVINTRHKAKAGCAFILSPARFLYWQAGRQNHPSARACGDSGRTAAVVWM